MRVEPISAETLARTGRIEVQPEIEVISAEPWAYRNRIQLHFEKGKVGYRQMRSHQLQPIDRCPISSPKLNECIGKLAGMVAAKTAGASIFSRATARCESTPGLGRPTTLSHQLRR